MPYVILTCAHVDMCACVQARGKKVLVKEQVGAHSRDDDWGNETLGEDLLPM